MENFNYLSNISFDYYYKKTADNLDDTTSEAHCHNSFEMLLVFSGNVDIIIENEHFNLSSQSIALIPPQKYHYIAHSGACTYERIVILFNEDCLPEQILSAIKKLPVLSLILSGTKAVDLSAKLKNLLLLKNNGIYHPLISGYMTELFYLFLSNSDNPNGLVTGSSNNMINQIIEYVNDHITEKISLDDVANHVFSSKSTVCHIFKNEVKTSVKQYVLQKKIALVEEMISSGATAISAANAVGYTNYANFYTIYKKLRGKSPLSD